MSHRNDQTVFLHLQQMKEIIDRTMGLMLSRHAARPSYGWIDLKLDAITGTDHFDTPGIRDKDHVYSWIQGRGLEALATHIQWYDRFSGVPVPDGQALLGLASRVAERLERARKNNGGHLGFCLNAEGAGNSPDDGRFTMSDLFCARGLYAFHRLHGTAEKAEAARAYLMDVLDAVLGGSFYNDQEGFDSSQYRTYHDSRSSYAGQMLALGGVTLLMRLERDPRAPRLARQLIGHVMDRHVNRGPRWAHVREQAIVEWVGPDGLPSRDEDGRISLDPGHALEFVGLTAQLLLSWRQGYEIEKETGQWMAGVEDSLYPLLQVNLACGFREPGGIVKSADGETGAPLHDSMPWWSLPETMRAIALVEKLGGTGPWSDWSHEWFETCFGAFMERYYRPSATDIAIQTIDTRGQAVPIIPATPDLDPGYHTGLSLISCHEALAEQAPLMYGGAEVDVTPDPGCRLSGHVARGNPASEVLDPLRARLCLLEAPYGKAALISVDVLEFSHAWVDRMRKKISALWDIGASNILFSATHTHTAPPVMDLGLLPIDEPYVNRLTERILQGCQDALKRRVPVRVEVASFSSPTGINRRGYDSRRKQTSMRPNPQGSRDDEVSLAALRDPAGKIRSVWVNTAVHPTTLGVSMSVVSADYPGRIADAVRRHLGPEVLVVPLTGACGDVRPAIMEADGSRFREGTEADIEAIGDRLGKKAVEALKRQGRVLVPPADGALLRLERQTVAFPMSPVPSRAELESLLQANEQRYRDALKAQEDLDEFVKLHDNPVWAVQMERAWAERLLALDEIPRTVEAELAVLALQDRLLLFAVPGELFSSVGKELKRMAGDRFALVAGYSGGSLGYLPTREAMDEGGYEVNDAYKYYGHAGPFAGDVEQTIVSTMKALMTRVRHA